MRTLNDITPPSRRSGAEPAAGGIDIRMPSSRGPLRMQEPRSPRFSYFVIGVVGVIILSIVALFYFSSAKVEVSPTTATAAIQGTFTGTETSGALPYEVVTTQKVASQAVKGSGTKAVTTSASGTITIYNTQTATQKLITNTRFATPEGLIFRIHAAVTVPGGSTTKPGSVTAKVYADQPGASYNVGPTNFTIPGFAGTAQEGKVYAKSGTSMTGGASGNVPVVDAATEREARAALRTALAADLAKSLSEKVQSGYILLPGAATTTYAEQLSTPSATTGMVDVKEQGTITAIVFPNAALAKAAAASVPSLGYHDEAVTLAPESSLALSATSLPDEGAASFSFTLSGTAAFVYTVDPTRIAAAVAGKTREAAQVALTNYPEVKRALIVLRPFWRQNFPQDPSSISVSVLKPE